MLMWDVTEAHDEFKNENFVYRTSFDIVLTLNFEYFHRTVELCLLFTNKFNQLRKHELFCTHTRAGENQ